MAKNKNKKTTFISSKSVVTDDFLNSIYGGLKGTEEESVYGTEDPLVGGHVHDGLSADGHAQKINLSKHVTGKLPASMIAGSFGKPSPPRRSIQFNSADSFGGSPAFSYYSSTDSVQLSKDYKFYYGSVDNTTSFYMQNTVAGTTSFMNFVSENTIDMIFKFGTIKNSTDLIYYYDGGDSSLYSNNDESNLGIATSSKFYIWDNLYAKDLVLYNNSATHFMDNYFAISARDQAEQLIIEFPKYRPTGNEKVMKVVSSPGVRADLTWDTFHSPGAPINGFQFNSADTFGGAETFYFEPSTRDVVFAKDHKWWFGSTDSSNSFWLEHEVDGSIPILEFYAKNTADSKFIFTHGAAGTTDIIVRLQNNLSYFYPQGTAYLGRKVFGELYKWENLLSNAVELYHNTGTTNNYITLKADDVVETYSMQLPKYRPTSTDMIIRVVSPGVSTELTWDNTITVQRVTAQTVDGELFQAQNVQANSLSVNGNYTFPTVDGLANYVLKTDGSGVVAWTIDEDTTINAGIGLSRTGNTIDVSGTINSVNIDTADVSSLTVNGNYTFPTVDGLANYILKTDGSGNVSWTVDGSGLQNVVEDTTPQLGGDLDAQNNDIISVNNIKFYNSGPIMRSTSFNRILFIDPSTTPHASNSVRIASIGNTSDAWDNGHASNISKLESDTGSKFLLASNGFANTSVIQINDNLDTTDSQSNLREGIELRAWETAGGIASVAIKSLSLNSTNGQPQSRSPELRFYNKDGNYIGLRAPNTTDSTSDYSFVLPENDGTTDQILRTDGNGNLSWVDQELNAAGSNIVITVNGTIETSGDILVNTLDSNFAEVNQLSIGGNYTLPTVDGLANYILKTDGSGVVTWTVDGGSGISNVVEDTTPELGGQLVAGANKISFASGNSTSELNFQHTWGQAGTPPGTEANHTYIATVKSFDLYLDMNGGDSGQAFRIYNNINPSSASTAPTDNNYIWKLDEDGVVYMTNNLLLGSTDNITIGSETVTSTKITQWDTAYSWGDHSVQGYLTTDSTVSVGTGLSKVGNTVSVQSSQSLNTLDAVNLSVNSNYTFPTVDGLANYILKTDGSGVVTWTVDKESEHWQTNSTNDIYYASGNMGVGISNPDVRFHMSGNAPNTSQLRMDQYSGDGGTAYDGPDIAFYSARGSVDNPKVRVANDYVGAFNMRYYNGSAYEAAGFFGWQVGDTPSNGSSWFNIKTNVGGDNRVRIKIEKTGAITFGNATDGTNFTFPLVDGTAGYMLATDGSGQLLWTEAETLPGGNNINVTGSGTVETQSDILINTLDATFAQIDSLNINNNYTLPTVDGLANYILKTDGSGVVTWTVDGGSGISNIVEDTTPQLGGGLSLNSNDITGTGNINITGDIAGNNLRANNTLRLLEGVEERTQEITNATGTTTHDCSAGHVFFHSSISGNFTVNLTNLSLATGYSTVVTLMLDQGGTGRDIVGLQIGGVGQTIGWQGGSGPTAGTNNIDVVTFSIYRSASAYIVLGQLMDFG